MDNNFLMIADNLVKNKWIEQIKHYTSWQQQKNSYLKPGLVSDLVWYNQ